MDSPPENLDCAAEIESRPIQSPPEVAAKRLAENGESEAPQRRKRARLDGGVRRRVAEIVLVLSAMARLRGGKRPTEAEVELMAEAREKLVELCGELAPREVVAREAAAAAIEDLGLNSKAKDQKLGFRGPRLTIAERFSQAKRKMEDSKKFPAQSPPFTPQPMQTSINPATESQGTSHPMRMIPSDKQSYQPIPSVGVASSPVSRVPMAMPTSIQHQFPNNDVKPLAASGSFPASANLGRDGSFNALPRVDRPPVRLEGGPLQGPASSSNAQSVNPPTWSVHSQAAKTGPEQNKQPPHVPVKVESTPQMNLPRLTSLRPRDQNHLPFVSQPTPGTLPGTVHQPVQPMNYSQASSLTNSHNEIVKIIQKLLQPKLPDHPTWIPPSRDYMNKGLACQICLIIMNDVDSVLICDACEKGYHSKCTQPSNQRGIPRGEWHCARCLALSNGKPLPPKYGRVMRSNTPLKVHPSLAGIQTLSEKKSGGSSSAQSPVQTATVAFSSSNTGSVVTNSPSPVAKETQKANSSPFSKNADEKKPVVESCASSSLKPSEPDSASSTIGLSEPSAQPINNLEESTCKDKPVELKSPLVDHLSDIDGNVDASSQPSEQPNSTEDTSEKPDEVNPSIASLDKLEINEKSESKLMDDDNKQDTALENAVESSADASGIMEDSINSSNESPSVEWIGDVIQVADEKTVYQICRVDGITYKAQDHVLCLSAHGKLTPSKIQSMWEDNNTGLKWVDVYRYIIPSDLPENLGRPCSADTSEVYESSQSSTIMAEQIKGLCEVLPQTKFEEESQSRNQLAPESNTGLPPIYLCKWLYDEVKGSFQPISG